MVRYKQRLRLAMMASALPGPGRQNVEVSLVLTIPRIVELALGLGVYGMVLGVYGGVERKARSTQRLRLASLASALHGPSSRSDEVLLVLATPRSVEKRSSFVATNTMSTQFGSIQKKSIQLVPIE